MKNYVRDWKDIIVTHNNKRYIFKAQIELGPKGGYYGQIIDVKKDRTLTVDWGRWFVDKDKSPLVRHKGNRMTDEDSLDIVKTLILMYEHKMEEEKAISTCHKRQMTDEERQIAVEKAEAREKKEYQNYSSSKEYESGVPYYFYRAKTKTVCAKLSIHVSPHVKRTHFGDPAIADMYRKYRGGCMNCNKRASCKLECLDTEDRSYIFRYITTMVDSEEVQEFYDSGKLNIATA